MVKPKYEPLEDGGELDLDTALTQAAQVLDAAAQFAVEEKDSKALVEIADRWMIMCNGLGGKPQKTEQKQPMGFGPPTQQTIGDKPHGTSN